MPIMAIVQKKAINSPKGRLLFGLRMVMGGYDVLTFFKWVRGIRGYY